jgi:hypothetical protein
MAVALPAILAAPAVAGAGLSADGAIRQGHVAGETAILKSQLRARELMSQVQMAETQAPISARDTVRSEQAATAEREATVGVAKR